MKKQAKNKQMAKNRSGNQKRRAVRRPLKLEWLESRVVLDGNISAFMRGGSLHIVGDSKGNEITIEQSALKSFTISSADGATTINGRTGPVTFNGVKRDLNINLGRGNDS